jgi:hypothetical protein
MNQSDNPNERRKEVVLADGKTYIEVRTLRHYWLFDRYEKKDEDPLYRVGSTRGRKCSRHSRQRTPIDQDAVVVGTSRNNRRRAPA